MKIRISKRQIFTRWFQYDYHHLELLIGLVDCSGCVFFVFF